MGKKSETTENTFLMKWTVEPCDEGQRLDHFLKQKYRNRSREFIKKFIQKGQVKLNHNPTKPSRILKQEDKVYVLSIRKNEPEVDLNYKIIHEDDHILVIDKPGNLPVHPTGRFFFNTLLTRLKVIYKNEMDQNKNFYIVHRVDRETSGVLVISKTKEACTNLVNQFFERKPKKEYLAIVHGIMKEEKYICEAPLAKNPNTTIRLKMHVPEGKGPYNKERPILPAKTIFKVEKRLKNYSIVRAIPHTGRQHQIRVHLSYLGHPVVGDKLYSTNREELFLNNINKPLKMEIEPGVFLHRHALHATNLGFFHPATHHWMEFSSELPMGLKSFLREVE